MNLRVLSITICCLVYLVKQGSTSHIKKIKQIVYDENHYDVAPCRHRQKVKYSYKEPPACDCAYHDEQLPEITFYQLGQYLDEEKLPSRYQKTSDDLSVHNPRLDGEKLPSVYQKTSDDLSVLNPRLRPEDFIYLLKLIRNEDNGESTLPALDPRLKPSDSDAPAENLPAENPPAENPPAENPPPESPPAESPPTENPPADNPPTDNPPAENTPPENPPTENTPETEPVITPEQWAEFIGSLTPGSIAWQNRNLRGRIM